MLNIPRILAGLLLSILIGYVAYRRRSLSQSGWLGAVLTGTLTFGFGGWTWGCALVFFFVTSSLLSRYRHTQKERIAGEKFEKGGQRDLMQALANGGIGALLALIYGLSNEPPLLLAMYAGTIGTVIADTWATELGVLARQPPRLITTLRLAPPGTSGAVTMAGTLAGAAGALLIGGVMTLLEWLERAAWSPWLMLVAVVGGVVGSLVDSLLGATLQASYRNYQGHETERANDPHGTPHPLIRGWRWMNNDAVNCLSSLAGAVAALGCWALVVR